MARDLNQLDYFILWTGGADGPKRQDQSDALTGAEIHMIKILVDATTFTVISVKNQANATVDMLDVNNLTGKEFSKGDLVSPPSGGYIIAYTASEETEYYRLPNASRIKQEA